MTLNPTDRPPGPKPKPTPPPPRRPPDVEDLRRNLPEVLKAKDVGAILEVAPETVVRLRFRRRHGLPGRVIGGVFVVTRERFLRWLEADAAAPVPDEDPEPAVRSPAARPEPPPPGSPHREASTARTDASPGRPRLRGPAAARPSTAEPPPAPDERRTHA